MREKHAVRGKNVVKGMVWMVVVSVWAGWAHSAPVVLDDFSSVNTVTNYMGYCSHTGGPRLEWNAVDGELSTYTTSTIGSRTAGFWWTGGDLLHPGDKIQVDIALGMRHLATGFRFGTSPFGKALTEEDRDTLGDGTIADGVGTVYVGTYWVNVSQSNTDHKFRVDAGTSTTGRGAIAGTELTSDLPGLTDFFTLVVTRGEGANQNVLTYSFEGDYFTGATGSLTFAGLTEEEGLYFALNQVVNSTANHRYANLVYTPIPEPATIGMLVATAAFLLGLRRYITRR